MILHFGVLDVPYATAMNVQTKAGSKISTTTGDVAEILEKRYEIFGHFYRMRSDEIMAALEKAMEVKLENLLLGAPVDENTPLFKEGDLSAIEERFRKFLDNRELDGVAPGVPTQTSLKGVNHRLKRPYVKSNPSRPSFIDTGTYQSHARVWVTE